MQIIVDRVWFFPDDPPNLATTTGTVSIDGKQVCFSLEHTAVMIPVGTFHLKLIYSPEFQRNTPHIIGVPNRTEIEVHGGNKAADSKGCICVALYRLGEYEIYDSKPATDLIELKLQQAEANGETNTIIVQ